MGPQLVRCGMRRLGRPDRFAGALLQWGRNLFVAECWICQGSITSAQDSFNGAATCSLRNARPSLRSVRSAVELQWGRNLFVAECV